VEVNEVEMSYLRQNFSKLSVLPVKMLQSRINYPKGSSGSAALQGSDPVWGLCTTVL